MNTGGSMNSGGSSNTGGATGSGGSMGSGGSDIVPGDPISAPAETWTFVPFDNAFCGDGSTTGIGVNLTDKSKNLVIFLMGGGACWDALTCYTLKTASNMDGYDEAKFQSDVNGVLQTSLFDRSDPQNPTKDYSFVFVPYCTGDVHAGDKIGNYNGTETHHKGLANLKAYLSRILPTFPDVSRVVLSGSSAGGFGTGFNWWRVQQVFSNARVDMINDSGQPLYSPYLSLNRQNEWRNAWNLNGALPPDCTECMNELAALIPYYGSKPQKGKAALLSYTKDDVISAFFEFIPTTYFEEGLKKVTADELEKINDFKYFYVAGESHVLLSDPSIASKGIVLKDWLRQMAEDDPAWANVNPWMP